MNNNKIGDYTIVGSLGKGGFGSVLKAQINDRIVAIKILNPQVAEDDRIVKKFFQEAMILAKLDHPNITKLFEFFPEGKNYAIVMEYVDGKPLKNLMLDGKLPLDQALDIAGQVLKAFQYAYENGVLHRDIKPANIMVDSNGNCKIMDFGIAKISDVASHDTALTMFSFHYTSPERFDSSKVLDQRSDIYCLGVVFYELFAGRRPFLVEETTKIMFSHIHEIPKPPNEFSADLPAKINLAILKALEKNPDDRFKDFKEFSEAIFGEGEIILTGARKNQGDTMEKASSSGVNKNDSGKGLKASGLDLLKESANKAYLELQKFVDRELKTQPKVFIGSVCVLAFFVIAIISSFFMFSSSHPENDKIQKQIVQASQQDLKNKELKDNKTKEETVKKNSKGFKEFINEKDKSVFVLIPEGEFLMGSDKSQTEKPSQLIYVDSFLIDKYLITNKQFKAFIDETRYITDAEKNGFGLVRAEDKWKKANGATWKNPDGFTAIDGKENNPVSQVSYNDALQYCIWAGKDLPTEAEWEKGARGPNGNEYPWGNIMPTGSLSNFDNFIGGTTPVDKYEAGQSFYGVYDMAGNLYQWCKDRYAVGEREKRNPKGPLQGKEAVLKGSTFIDGGDSLRSSTRASLVPNFSSFLFGFRCACRDTNKFK